MWSNLLSNQNHLFFSMFIQQNHNIYNHPTFEEWKFPQKSDSLFTFFFRAGLKNCHLGLKHRRPATVSDCPDAKKDFIHARKTFHLRLVGRTLTPQSQDLYRIGLPKRKSYSKMEQSQNFGTNFKMISVKYAFVRCFAAIILTYTRPRCILDTLHDPISKIHDILFVMVVVQCASGERNWREILFWRFRLLLSLPP